MADNDDEEEEEERTANDYWKKTLHSNYHKPLSSLSSPSFSLPPHTLSPLRFAARSPLHRIRREDDFSVFPPKNHEALAVVCTPSPPRAPLSAPVFPSFPDVNSRPPPPSPSPSPSPAKPPDPDAQFPRWLDLALHFWNSKLKFALSHVRSLGFFRWFRLVAYVLPYLIVVWFWVRRLRWWRRQRCVGQESVEELKLLIKEQDEKILELLEQIAQMNKLFLARYRIPVIRSS